MQGLRNAELYCDTCNGLLEDLPESYALYCANYDCPDYTFYVYL